MPLQPFAISIHFKGPTFFVETVNGQELLPTHGIAHGLGISIDLIEALHVVPFQLTDVPNADVVAIVQQVGDIPIGSMERLLIVDSVFYHSPVNGTVNSPTIIREVHRVGHVIIRHQLLMGAHISWSGHMMAAQVTVYLDAVAWDEDDHAPRIVRTGSFAQVIVDSTTVQEGQPQASASSTQSLPDIFGARQQSHPPQENMDDLNLMQKTLLRPSRLPDTQLPVDEDKPLQFCHSTMPGPRAGQAEQCIGLAFSPPELVTECSASKSLGNVSPPP